MDGPFQAYGGETVRSLIVMLGVIVEILALTLPGYCSAWLPVWVQVTDLVGGIVVLAFAAAWLAELWKNRNA